MDIAQRSQETGGGLKQVRRGILMGKKERLVRI